MERPLEIDREVSIPAAELSWRFDPSGGPGGQHANRSSTRVVLSFDLGASPSVPDALRALMLDRLGGRVRHGVVTVIVDESRSQWRNRAIARRRLARLLRTAAHRQAVRHPTRPTAAARRRRLEAKRRRGAQKRLRRPPEPE